MRIAYATDPIRERIAAQEKAERDEISRLHTARLEGQARGRAEGQREVARRMLAAGMTAETILNLTGVCLEELRQNED
jgi:predicted transposase/invertase (TIGR01784 family)